MLSDELRTPDAQGRIVIGKEHAGQTFSIERMPDGDIVLHPVMVVHQREAWLYNNPEALASLKRGIEQAEKGELHDLGSFAEFAVDDDSVED